MCYSTRILCCDVATHEGYINSWYHPSCLLYNLVVSDQSLLTERLRTWYEASFWLSVVPFMSKLIDAIYKSIKLCIVQWKNIIYNWRWHKHILDSFFSYRHSWIMLYSYEDIKNTSEWSGAQLVPVRLSFEIRHELKTQQIILSIRN